MSGKTSAGFVAYVYEEDYYEIQKLVQQYPNIETGGDLFGLWKNENTVVIQLFIGPGKKCERTTSSFHQDIDYLKRVGSLVTTEGGLCNVGEWHSHHQIGMPEPSAADRRTVFNNMPQLGLERFVLFIASIESKRPASKKRVRDRVELERIKLRSFLFLGSKRSVVSGRIEIIRGGNPHNLHNRARLEIQSGKETPLIEDRERKLSKSSDDNSPHVTAPQQPKEMNKDEKTRDEISPSQRATEERERAEEKDQLKLTRQTNEKQPRPNVQRNTKPRKTSGAAPLVQSNGARKIQNDQEGCVEVQSPGKTSEGEPNQPPVRTGISKENYSPNTACQFQYPNIPSYSATAPTSEHGSPQGNFLQPATWGRDTPRYVASQSISQPMQSTYQYTAPPTSGNRGSLASMQHPPAQASVLDHGHRKQTLSHATPTPQMMPYPSSHTSPKQQPTAKISTQNPIKRSKSVQKVGAVLPVDAGKLSGRGFF